MVCEVCGMERVAGSPVCVQCGYPLVGAESAHAMKEAADLSAIGDLDNAIRKLQQAARSSPESYIPHLKLVALLKRKAVDGGVVFKRLAEQECRKALAFAPLEKEVHFERVRMALELGDNMEALKVQYEAKERELPFAGEVVKMIDALSTLAVTRVADTLPPAQAKLRFRLLFLGALFVGTSGIIQLVVVLKKASADAAFRILGSASFYQCIALLTGAAVFMAEAVRMWKRGQRL